MTKLEIRKIKNSLSTVGTKFTIYGHREVFKVGDGYIANDAVFGKQMNISYTGSTKICLYTYDMLGKKSTGTILFNTVTIITE